MLTDGARGGTFDGEPYRAVAAAGADRDTYGAGDSFAAALAFALARGDAPATRSSSRHAPARPCSRRGPYEAQLALRG